MEYPKIETLYDRDDKTFKVIPGAFRLPEFDLVKRWLVTEKIDGTNIRIHLKDGAVVYGGRTDAAQLYAPLVAWLQENLSAEKVTGAFDPGTQAILFGEGYGAKIQKGGGNYRDGVAFRLFDVVVIGQERKWWLNWSDVCDVARKLGINTAPLIGTMTLEEIETALHDQSRTAHEDGGAGCIHEGVVARTAPLLLTRNGHRLVWKLKVKDLATPTVGQSMKPVLVRSEP